MRLSWCLIAFPAAIVSGCAEDGYLLDRTVPTKTAFTSPELARYGFDARETQCVAGRLGGALSIWQLRQLREAAAAANPAAAAGTLKERDFWNVASGIRDRETPGEVARAIEACGVTAEAPTVQAPPTPGDAAVRSSDAAAPPAKKQNGPRDYEPSENLLSALAAYERGDFAATVKLAKAAADAGDSGAQQFLGGLYAAGIGGPANPAEAARYYRLAAEQGWSEAMNNLGKAYETGQGVPRDVVEASKWYLLASARATEDEEMVARNRQNLLGQMTLEQIEKAAELAREWERTHR